MGRTECWETRGGGVGEEREGVQRWRRMLCEDSREAGGLLPEDGASGVDRMRVFDGKAGVQGGPETLRGRWIPAHQHPPPWLGHPREPAPALSFQHASGYFRALPGASEQRL